MATFWTWALRNPFIFMGGLMLAAGATGVLEWGLALSGVSFSTLIALSANHLAGRSRERRQVAIAIAEAQVIRMSSQKRRHSHLDFVDGGEAPYEHAA